MRYGLSLSVAFLTITLAASVARAAQPVYVGPYALFKTILFDIDYAVSTANTSSQAAVGSETIVSIGLASNAPSTGASCQAQVDWFDWDGTPAGLSGGVPTPGAGPFLVAGQTLEYTTSLVPANPNEYPPFTQNVFRDTTNPSGSKVAFEGYAQIRVMCPAGTPQPKIRVDAEVVKTQIGTGGVIGFQYKPINVTKTTGLIGY
jgi:hypothetical protein